MSSSDEEDVHICGRCKLAFNDLGHYVIHKKANYCRKQKSTRISATTTLSDLAETSPNQAFGFAHQTPRDVSMDTDSGFQRIRLVEANSSLKPDHDYSRTRDSDDGRSRGSAKKQEEPLPNMDSTALIVNDALENQAIDGDEIYINPQPLLTSEESESIVSNQLIVETCELHQSPAVEEYEQPSGEITEVEKSVAATQVETAPTEVIVQCISPVPPEELQREQDSKSVKTVEVPATVRPTRAQRKRKKVDYVELSEGNDTSITEAVNASDKRERDCITEKYMDSNERKFVCGLCRHSFISTKKLNTHKKLNHKYRCTISECKYQFTSNLNLEAHIQDEHPLNTSVVCPVCGRSLTRRLWTWCEHHEKLHTPMHSRADLAVIGEIPSMDGDPDKLEEFQCPICCRILGDEASFSRHLDLHRVWIEAEDTTNAPCSSRIQHSDGDSSLEKTTSSIQTKISDTNKYDDKIGYPCYVCPVIFDDFDEAQNHKRIAHKMKQIFRCIQPKCYQNFQDGDSFISHIKCHIQRACICRICNDHFTDRGMLMSHQVQLHKSNYSLDGFRCDKCGRILTSQKCLDDHLARVEHEYSCEHCDKTFINTTRLNSHKSSNHVTQVGSSNLCDICGMSFPRKPLLKRHLQLHETTDDKKCPYCGRSFEMKEYLNRHVRTMHMNWRPLQCPEAECGKRFVTQSKLERHIDTHNKERKFECPMCGKKYRSRDVLYKHCKAFCSQFCDLCKESFAHQEELEIHSIERHPDHYYFCQFCFSIGETLTDLKQHIVQQHMKKIKRMFTTEVNLGDEKFQAMPTETMQSLLNTNHSMIMLQLRKNTTVYRCDVTNCGKEFKEKKKLKDHVRTHSVVKGIHCQFCNFVTKTQDSYRKHKRRSHTCKIYPCNAVIGRADEMKEHLVQAHPEYNDRLVCHLCPKLTTFEKLNEIEYNKHIEKHANHGERRQQRDPDKSSSAPFSQGRHQASTDETVVQTSLIIDESTISEVVANSANTVEVYQISFETETGNVETTDILLVQN